MTIVDICGFADGMHVRPPSKAHPSVKAYRQICRFLDTLHIHSSELQLDDDDVAIINRHIRFVMRRVRELDPEGVHGIRRGRGDPYPLPPSSLWGKILYQDWIATDFDFDELVTVPRYLDHRENVLRGIGAEFSRGGDRVCSLLRKLGYLEATMLFEDVSRATVGDDFMKMYLTGQYDFMYRYVVVEPVPELYTYFPEVW